MRESDFACEDFGLEAVAESDQSSRNGLDGFGALAEHPLTAECE